MSVSRKHTCRYLDYLVLRRYKHSKTFLYATQRELVLINSYIWRSTGRSSSRILRQSCRSLLLFLLIIDSLVDYLLGGGAGGT